jgi:hypothetical protein
MISILLSVAAFALLFALLGALRPRAGCTGNCSACRGESCPSLSQSGDHHV